MIWYRLSGASSLDLPIMAEHYQERIRSSRYFREISEKVQKSLITPITKRLHGLEMD